MRRVRKVLRSLNQTRESLSVEESFLEQPGQLLDKASTKQIAIRKAQLDSLGAPKKENVSVIVRCSTTDPETECSKVPSSAQLKIGARYQLAGADNS